MDAGAWYLTLFALGTGVAILAYWGLALVFERLPLPAADRGDPVLHVLAESATGIVLIAAGLARLMTGSTWVYPLTGVGLGALAYALIQSPAFYPEHRAMRLVFASAWLFAAPAIVLLILGG